jgi:hypothetical protein
MDGLKIAELPVSVSAVYEDGHVDLSIGGIPAVLEDIRLSVLETERIVYLVSDYSRSDWNWDVLTSVLRDGEKWSGFTDDERILKVAFMIAYGETSSIPVGEVLP